jgi:hypothetical protein
MVEGVVDGERVVGFGAGDGLQAV